MILDILRLTNSGPTFGVLSFDGKPRLVTLELPWRNNERSISCIPEGEYQAERDHQVVTGGGLKIPTTFRLLDVPNRSGILFHIGNYERDTNGCILVGRSFADGFIQNSQMAFNLFLELLAGYDTITVKISTRL